MPQSTDPRMNQWQLRFNQANARVRAAEQSGDPASKRAAYEQLRQVQMAKPAGQASSGQMRQSTPKPKAQTQRRKGVLSTITDALRGANQR